MDTNTSAGNSEASLSTSAMYKPDASQTDSSAPKPRTITPCRLQPNAIQKPGDLKTPKPETPTPKVDAWDGIIVRDFAYHTT
jgi:hypothetical protein